ncbi:MAG: type I glutamate--ammonia ligase [Oscillospiraceae bacterium]|nr:MAG: type I glutamate--ammonia ligase [Oscillospiraceae bacterium]
MIYTAQEVFDFVKEEDVKFIRLAFCDTLGRQKNISILPSELRRAFEDGISFDASAICGFGGAEKSDLLLFPDPSTLNILPWRPSHGKVVRMFCDIRHPDGTPFSRDTRAILRRAVADAKAAGITVQFGAEIEFYLFKTDENGDPTKIPFDHATYMDVAPEDKGENVRREICLTLLDMGIQPESSHHEEGPGQNEIDFRYSDAMRAADDAMNFITVVKATARQNGLYADFSPKPLENESGNGLHINMSVKCADGTDRTPAFMAGILAHIRDLTAFLNPSEASYSRFGKCKAPKFVTWSHENRSQLIRIPAAKGEYRRIELRSPDPSANPYLAYALLIWAGLDGIAKDMCPAPAVNLNLLAAPESETREFDTLPGSLKEAVALANGSALVRRVLGEDAASFLTDVRR